MMDGEPSPRIEQGPEVLVELLTDPQPWLVVLLIVVAVTVSVAAYLGYRRHGLTPEVLEEMGEIGAIVSSITVCTVMSTQALDLGYAVDVLGGTVTGFLIARYLIWAYHQQQSKDESSELPAAES